MRPPWSDALMVLAGAEAETACPALLVPRVWPGPVWTHRVRDRPRVVEAERRDPASGLFPVSCFGRRREKARSPNRGARSADADPTDVVVARPRLAGAVHGARDPLVRPGRDPFPDRRAAQRDRMAAGAT